MRRLFVEWMNIQVRCRYYLGTLIISFTTTLHEECSVYFADLVADYNAGLSGNSRHPIRWQGTAEVKGKDLNALPNLRMTSDPVNRFVNSPNFILESTSYLVKTPVNSMTI